MNLLLRFSLLRLTSTAAGLPLPLISTLRASSNYANLQSQSFCNLGRNGTKFPQPSFSYLSQNFHRNLSTEHSSPPSHTEVTSASPTEIFESSSQEIWAADAAKTLEEGETLASLGLGGYSPSGLVQYILDLVHTTTGLPWWVTIVATTLCFKFAFVPLSIYAREGAIKMRKINPQVELLRSRQKTFLLARDLDRANQEKAKMSRLFKENGVRPILAMMPTLVQGVVMFSFFFAIRKMAYAPVTSMMTGGTLWFVDLTLPDPTYMLPLISSALLIANLELGGEVGVSTPQMENMKWLLRLVSIVMIIPVSQFPSGLLVFWVTSNSFTISYALMMKALDSIKGTQPAEATPTESQNPMEMVSRFFENQKTKALIGAKQDEVKVAKRLYNKQLRDKNPKLYKRKPLPKK